MNSLNGIIQVIFSIGIVILGILCAVNGKWEMLGAIITGAFAVINPVQRLLPGPLPATPTGDPDAKVKTPPDAGFARMRLLLPLAFAGVFLAALACLHGCATTGTGAKETPQSVTAKSLLSARQGVIAAARVADSLCAQGVMKQTDCDQARETYEEAQTAYTAAADAYLLYLTSADAANQQRADAAVNRLVALCTSLNSLVTTFQGGGK
ncbi:MAG TPA: hypothetical protein VF795_11650 [Desulfuromonadaceae bacterium]